MCALIMCNNTRVPLVVPCGAPDESVVCGLGTLHWSGAVVQTAPLRLCLSFLTADSLETHWGALYWCDHPSIDKKILPSLFCYGIIE